MYDWKSFADENRLGKNVVGKEYSIVRVERGYACYFLKYFILYLKLWGKTSDI